jgi:hypothetical protein
MRPYFFMLFVVNLLTARCAGNGIGRHHLHIRKKNRSPFQAPARSNAT